MLDWLVNQIFFLNCLYDTIPRWTIKTKKKSALYCFRGDNKVDDPAVLESIVSAAAWCSKKERGYSLKFLFMSISLPKTTPTLLGKRAVAVKVHIVTA